MKTIRVIFGAACAVTFLMLAAFSASAVELTTNTFIGALDTSFDGADLVISNCTVTMDGSHAFNSLLITNGGVLTHSFFPSGIGTIAFSVTNESQTLTGTNAVTLLNTNVQPGVVVMNVGETMTYSNGVDFVQTSLADGTAEIYRTETSSIPDGATVLVSYAWAFTYAAGLHLIVSNDVAVAVGASINVNGVGYGSGQGSGHGNISGNAYTAGSGGGHGGSGGSGFDPIGEVLVPGGICYGSLDQSTTLGSGGGSSYAGEGGLGGGQIQISAGGTASLDGLLSANGADATNSRAGGGAGGSIWIAAPNITGSGTIIANGGKGEPIYGGGGGGGRILLQCGTNNFSGNITAYGGSGWQFGGAGSIFTQTGSQAGIVLMDNGEHAGAASTITLTNLSDLMIAGCARVVPVGGFQCGNLTINSNSTLTSTALMSLHLAIDGNATIQAGGSLTVDSLGYASGAGISPGHFSYADSHYPGSGGGYGGNGGLGLITNSTPAGTSYGSQGDPLIFGSGGGGSESGGGAGGGVVQLNVSGTLQVDGILSANGGNGLGSGGGGGAGGSVYLMCDELMGSGSITANGGNGVAGYGGGGGGGRIAVIAPTNNFGGTLSAYGGGGINQGGAGTIFLQTGNQTQLILDNNGIPGASTVLQSASGVDLVVQNGAAGTANSVVNFGSLLVTSNAWLRQFSSSSASLTVSGDAVFQQGGGFDANLAGETSGRGLGAGGFYSSSPYYYGGGGGHGGRGGNSTNNLAIGGYYVGDAPQSPSYNYSGAGGGGYVPYSIGGTGGGFIRMTVAGTLQLDGAISANAGDGSGIGGGGGAGGGIYLTVGTLAGKGSITANGGNGANGVGGGGGGGRIAIYFNTDDFAGTMTTLGGNGANYGGAGTIYLKTNYLPFSTIIVDNGDHDGADTPLQAYNIADLTIQNGGVGSVNGPFSFRNITIHSNACLYATNGYIGTITISANNFEIQAGGKCTADSSGYNGGTGPGAGGGYGYSPFFPCAGAGHGGYGGNAISNSFQYGYGGGYYDTPSNPNTSGSGGGRYGSFSFGGAGGGSLNLSLTGNLLVDGSLSVNGENGSGTGGGGGSGGCLRIACKTLAGNGRIAANGGDGANAIGGGGAGGMIFASVYSNAFSGTISAYGGGGANYGGAGTIYFQTNNQSMLLVDNDGHMGTNTALVNADHLIIRNGGVAFPVSYLTVGSLLVDSNAWLVPNHSEGFRVTVTGNATVKRGGGILADGYGNQQNTGTGRGFSNNNLPYYPCSGGGHGGYGASSLSNLVSGGIAYDNYIQPAAAGSGGGGFSPYSVGGSGGGNMLLNVNGDLQLDGSITANGGNGSGSGGGGGAGGAIYLSLGTLSGAGNISANGGNGANSYGGGGGGGRVSIIVQSNNFAGGISAFGGGGANYGGAGTIYIKTYSQPYGSLLLDNAGHSGTNTSFGFASGTDVTIQNHAIGLMPPTAHNILIRSNSSLVAIPAPSLNLLSVNNLTIDAGGALNLDADGSSSQSGLGAGYDPYPHHGGAGHGGYGGDNAPGGGKAYDSISFPTFAGSGGASYYGGLGGSGGGALRLSVLETLTVNGRLSANGGNGDYNSGGGSGGTLNLSRVNTLSGSGIISANGGDTGGGVAGGGGGGRIALICNSNNFTGQITANGGNGFYPGGAGTIYLQMNGTNTLIVDNGGVHGTNTPLGSDFSMPGPPFDLNISGAAVVVPIGPLPLINNFNLAAGATLTAPNAQTNLVLAVQNNALVAGHFTMDSLGYPQAAGPGAGTTNVNQGSGGGYGGAGGNSASGAIGGTVYGSAMHPTDFGSGGGQGALDGIAGGSEGGGAIRLSVGGTLNVDGNISANGDYGWQDNSGGGAGGSIWITAGEFAGAGSLSAAGGNGDLYNGGGGGGGRIAIYAPTNLFVGTTNVNGGMGAQDGQPGSVFVSGAPLDFQVVGQSPTGVVSNTVDHVDLNFNEVVDAASLSANDFTLTTPAGVLSPGNLSVSAIDVAKVRISFPAQNLNGSYSIRAATSVKDLFGIPLASAYTGDFTLSLPTISGTVTDTNGTPVAGVNLQPDGGLIGTTTDADGKYALDIPPGWSGMVTPSSSTGIFAPKSLSYTNVTDSLTNQNFVLVLNIAKPILSSSMSGTNLTLSWTGMTGVNYQTQYSTNLVNWLPYGEIVPGTNGPMQLSLPLGTDPEEFYRLSATP